MKNTNKDAGMSEEQLEFDQDKLVKYLIDNLIWTKARLLSLEVCFLAYVELRTPELTDKFRNAILLEEKKLTQKELDDLRVLSQGLSEALRKELDDLGPSK